MGQCTRQLNILIPKSIIRKKERGNSLQKDLELSRKTILKVKDREWSSLTPCQTWTYMCVGSLRSQVVLLTTLLG